MFSWLLSKFVLFPLPYLKSFLAFDLGATGGRTILDTIEHGRLQMKELSRFSNQILQIGNHIHWNIYSLFEHLKEGLVTAKREDVAIASIGIDTWGVDFVLLAEDGSILGAPYVMMREDVYKNITAEDIAKNLGISYSGFRRAFKELTGTSPSKYMMELKLNKAKLLLYNTALPIKEISYSLNFENPDYFPIFFKKRTGKTPSEYRSFACTNCI
jgi:AraC-like DNA-binding protein